MGNYNNLSSVSFGVMERALKRHALLDVPVSLQALVEECLQVPERPETYHVRFQEPEQVVVAIPVTGGLDSTVLYYRANYGLANHEAVPKAYYVDYGQPYAIKEQMALARLDVPYSLMQAEKPLGRYWKHIIPARNLLIFSMIAEKLQGGGRILFAVTNGEMPERGGDKSVRFLNLLNTALQALPYPVTVETPLANETKPDLITWWKNAGLDLKLLQYTVSCFTGGVGVVSHCGECQACLRKYIAFYLNGMELATAQPIEIGCMQFIERYKRVMSEALETRNFLKYSERRCVQDLSVLNLL